MATGKHLTEEEEEEAESRPLSPQHGGNGNAGARRGGGLSLGKGGSGEERKSSFRPPPPLGGEWADGDINCSSKGRKKELKASFFPLHPNPHPPRVPCREAVIPGSAAERGEETFSKFPETLSFP